MVDCDTVFGGDLLKVAIRNGIAHINEDGVQDNSFGKLSPFEIDHYRSPFNVSSSRSAIT